MLQIIEQTDQEKFDMYNKLSKKELIIMLIEANRHLSRKPYAVVEERQKTYGDVCSCNPANGGNGVFGCVIANNPIRSHNYEYFTNLTSTFNTCHCGRGERLMGESYCKQCLDNNPLLCT